MRRKGAWAAVGILPALIAANYMPRLVLFVFCACLVLALVVIGWFRFRNKLKKVFFLVASVCMASVYFLTLCEIMDRPIFQCDSQKVTARVVLLKNSSGYWLSKVEQASCNGRSVFLRGETYIPMFSYEAEPYDIADVEFVLHRDENGEHGRFLADDVKIIRISQPERKKLIQYFDEFRERVITLLQVRIGDEEGVFAASVLTGESGDLSFDTQLNFSRSGLLHIMAVSGLHLSVLSGAVSYLLSKINAHRTAVILLSLLLCVLVMVLGGFSVSVLRAGIMSAILLFGRLGYREADSINSLGVSLIVIGFLFPFSVADPAYLLSGAATLGILVLSPILEQFALSRMVFTGWQRQQVSLMCVSISSAVFTAPILIFFFGELSLVSVPAMSIVNYPVVLVLLGSALFCCLYWIPFIGPFIGFMVRMAAKLVLELVELFAGLEQATVSVRCLPMIIAVGGTFLVFCFWFILKNKPIIQKILTGSLLCLSVLLLCITPFYSSVFSRLTVMLDGASIYINHGKSIVVDCPDAYAANQINREIGKYGFDKIDVLVVTSLDRYISNGVPYLLSYTSARKIVVPKSDLHNDSYRRIIEAAQKANIEIILLNGDHQISLNPIQLNVYEVEEQGYVVKITDGVRSAGVFSTLNDDIITHGLQYPMGEWGVDTLLVGAKAVKGSVNGKLMYITKPDMLVFSSGRRLLTLDERMDIIGADADLRELSLARSKLTYDYRKEKLWI